MTKISETIKTTLEQFTGTSQYYKHPLFGFIYTDGIHYLAEACQCYWLLDIIGSYQFKLTNVPYQIWELKVKDTQGIITVKEDSNAPILFKQKIEYTDFPLQFMELWLIDNTLILPSEY